MKRRANGEGSEPKEYRPGKWRANYYGADGKRRTVYGRTKTECRNALREALNDARAGIVPAPRQTVEDYLNEWLARWVSQRAPRTLAAYRETCERYIVPEVGRIPLSELRPDHVQDMVNRLLTRPTTRNKNGYLSPTTVRAVYSVLRMALGRALKLGKVRVNVATLIDPPRKAEPPTQFWSPDEVARFLGHLARSNDRLAALYHVTLGLGLRQGEALGLSWDDLDLDTGYAVIGWQLVRGTHERKMPKGEKTRVLSLPDPVVAALRSHKARQNAERLAAGREWRNTLNLVFTTPDGAPLDGTNVNKGFVLRMKAAGVDRIRFHDMRHTTATYLLAQGHTLEDIAQVLGHSDLRMTQRYAHVVPETTRRTAATMAGLLKGATG